jgi:hypothetical protein
MLFMRFENHMQAKNRLNMCSDGIFHHIELVLIKKMDVVSIRHCTYMEGPVKIINKFNSANFHSDI